MSASLGTEVPQRGPGAEADDILQINVARMSVGERSKAFAMHKR